MNTSPMTELEAVNLMLLTIGEQPVNSLVASGVVEAEIAKASLVDASRDVQTQGWHFNTDRGIKLMPDEKGLIDLPRNCLRIDTTGCSRHVDVVQRGLRLYDRKKNTYRFDNALTLDMVVMLKWQELPQFARKYITVVACRRFQERTAASQVIEGFTQRDEHETRLALESADAENADYNIVTDNYPNISTISRR